MTERGGATASSAPLITGGWERLVATGQATEPSSAVDPRAIVPADTGVDVSARLAALREEER